MMNASVPPRRFDAAIVAGLDEPVRRYFQHAIRDGAPLPPGVQVAMRGQIRLGTWLPFTAQQHCAPDSFVWRARVGFGPLTLFHVVDSFAPGTGVMDVRLFGRARMVHSEDENTARSSAGRAALDAAAYAPPVLLSQPGLRCAARSDELIVCTWDVPPERPEVHIRIDHDGAVHSVSALRWGKQGTKNYEYIPCGGDIHAERRFGDYLLPSSFSVGWWWGTPRFKPFFQAELHDVVAAPRTRDAAMRGLGPIDS